MKNPIYIKMIFNDTKGDWVLGDCGFIVKFLLTSHDSLNIIIQINNSIIVCTKYSFKVITYKEFCDYRIKKSKDEQDKKEN